MANLAKYDKLQALAIINHCERTAATHSNEKIDPKRTESNYALWPQDDPDQLQLDSGIVGQSSGRYAYQRLKKRLSEVSYLRRKDLHVLCDWVIHLGVDTLPGYEHQKDFFEACVRYIASLYGKENIIYAWVHMDEDTPHIHVGFVPVITKPLRLRKNASEAKRKAYEALIASGVTSVQRVDANSVITLRHLQDWHGAFSKWMTEELSYDPGVHTGITEALGGNLTVKQLKGKGKGWAETRKRQAKAFHDARRAGREGRKPTLESQLQLTKPKIQAEPGRHPSLIAQIQSARDRGGKQ